MYLTSFIRISKMSTLLWNLSYDSNYFHTIPFPSLFAYFSKKLKDTSATCRIKGCTKVLANVRQSYFVFECRLVEAARVSRVYIRRVYVFKYVQAIARVHPLAFTWLAYLCVNETINLVISDKWKLWTQRCCEL